MSTIISDITELFEKGIPKLLVTLAAAGIGLTVYPVYEGLYGDTERKIKLIKEWRSIDSVTLIPEKAKDVVFEQLCTELENSGSRVEATLSILSKKRANDSAWTYIWKFFAGLSLFFLTYGMTLFFYFVQKRDKKTSLGAKIISDNVHIIVITLCLGAINAVIPFVSPIINYVFLPSCLSLLSAIIMMIWSDVAKLIETKTKAAENELAGF
jgi:hypothetical protein